jgi:23S rRNA pseudouridine1911/1915/1917 synthase
LGGGPEAERRRLVVDAADGAGARLDAWLAARLTDVSRSRVVQLIEQGRVLVDGRPARKSRRLEGDEVVEVEVPPPEPSQLTAEPIALNIVYQDGDLLVIDKPAGLVVHPAPGHGRGTLVHGLLWHVGDLSGIGGVRRPGIVHRLDRDTSGLIIVAKNDTAHRRLATALGRRAVRRRYLTAAWGHLGAEVRTVDAPIGRSGRDRRRMAVTPEGRAARTRFRVLERWRAAELLEAELETGRTHQIRVHLAHIGHPVVGDRIYGAGAERGISGPGRAWAAALARRVPRQFLHAAELAFEHPRTGERLAFRSPLPPELEAAARWARGPEGTDSVDRRNMPRL